MAARDPRKHPRPQWLERHLNDPYVKQAQRDGYRSRAAYKLLEIDTMERLLRPGQRVVELGSAPGAWTQVLAQKVLGVGKSGATAAGGQVLALDLLPMEPVERVEFILGDFHDEAVLAELESRLEGRRVDLVLSDMAPNLSGVAASDSARMGALAELAIEFGTRHLKPDGAILIKCFHGSGFSQVVERLKKDFLQVRERKPVASRAESAETYLLARRPRPGAKVAEKPHESAGDR